MCCIKMRVRECQAALICRRYYLRRYRVPCSSRPSLVCVTLQIGSSGKGAMRNDTPVWASRLLHPFLCLVPRHVESNPTPRLDRSRLHSSVGILQAVPEHVVALIGEPGVGLSLQGAELRGQVCELSGEVLGGVPIVARSTHYLQFWRLRPRVPLELVLRKSTHRFSIRSLQLDDLGGLSFVSFVEDDNSPLRFAVWLPPELLPHPLYDDADHLVDYSRSGLGCQPDQHNSYHSGGPKPSCLSTL
jgi:hypothetical protein